MRSEIRHPAGALVSTLLISIGLSLVVVFSSAPVHAAGTCGQPPPATGVQVSGDESGIGGTGVREVRPDRPNAFDTSGDDSESGIGGTGIFGTVTQLNRLCVNGLEIRLSQQLQSQQHEQLSAEAGFDGQQLAIGQVVWIRALESAEGLVASAIEVHPGLSGEIEKIASNGRELVVSEQIIELSAGTLRGPGLPDEAFAVGQSVVVHGLRDDRDRLIASRIEIDGRHGVADDPAHSLNPTTHWLAERLARNEAPRALSIEGYVRGNGDRLLLTGMPMEFAPSWPTPERPTLRPGSHITVEGRISSEGILRIDRSRNLQRPNRPTPPERRHPSDPNSRSLKPPRDEQAPESPAPSTIPRNARDRGHLSHKHRPPRLDRPERRPAPLPERPTTLDRLAR